jgi:hypothetical protein
MMKLGTLLGIDGSRGSNHGCTDWAIAEYTGDGKAKIIDADSCHSCWQVGHDADHVFYEVGDEIDLADFRVAETEEHWSTPVDYELR